MFNAKPNAGTRHAQSPSNPQRKAGPPDQRFEPANTDRPQGSRLPSKPPETEREQKDLVNRIVEATRYRPEDRLADLSNLACEIFRAPRASENVSRQLLMDVLHGTGKLAREIRRSENEGERSQRGLTPQLEALMPHLSVLNRTLQERIGELDGRNVANAVWAIATIGLKDEKLLTALSRRAVEKAKYFSPRDVALSSWGFAALGFRDEALFRAISRRAQVKMDHLSGRDIANTAWAFATLGIKDDALFRALSNRATQTRPDSLPRDVANTAWALSLNNADLVPKVCSESDLQVECSQTEWLQMYHALLIAGAITPEHSQDRFGEINTRFRPSAANKFEKDVRNWLVNEVRIKEEEIKGQVVVKGIATDWVVERNGRKLVIECDGDLWHRTSGPDGDVPFGRDNIQDKVFAACGYRVMHIRDGDFYHAPREALRAQVEAALAPQLGSGVWGGVARAGWWVVATAGKLVGRFAAAAFRMGREQLNEG